MIENGATVITITREFPVSGWLLWLFLGELVVFWGVILFMLAGIALDTWKDAWRK